MDIAVGNPDFSTLVAASAAAGLVDVLNGEGPFTVFAPTNDAFAKLPQETLDALLADPTGDLTQILLYHVIEGKVMAADVIDGMSAATVQGAPVTFSVVDGVVKINDATVTIADIEASNGVIHVIDTVLIPPAAEAAPAEEAAAPAEEVAAEEVMTDTAEAMVEEVAAPQSIVDIAVSNPDFSTLVAAVTAAGLVDTLSGEGPFTVFAPTNAAFAKLPQETLDALLADPTGGLTQILLYHVVPGKVMAADVTDGLTVATVQGSPVTFSVVDGVVKINDATITVTDIEASNGVIHVIDTVITPPAAEAAPEAMAEEMPAAPQSIVDIAVGNPDFSTLVAAVSAAGLVDALSGEGPFTVFAPTNDAFAKLPADTLNALLADPTGDLTQILLYHVSPAR